MRPMRPEGTDAPGLADAHLARAPATVRDDRAAADRVTRGENGAVLG